MKKILRLGVFSLVVNMFFTGCGSGSLVSGLGDGYKEIKGQVVETQESREQLGESGLKEGETLSEKEMPDFYEESSEDGKKKVEGKPAFKIKDGHSKATKDMESFDVGTLQSDGTFIYCYSTKVGELAEDAKTDDRKIVHCMAAYNYKTEAFKVIHEKEYSRTTSEKDEDKEAFYMQMCSSDGTGNMFVYDYGRGYVYDATGALKFEADIETFVRKHFKGYSIVATEAFMKSMSSGGTRMYVDITVEKEEISSAEDDGADISEEQADEEAEKLDSEVDQKTIETVLVYDFQEYTSSIDQTNVKLDAQIANWQSMAGTVEGDPPSASDDWDTAVQNVPTEWGPSYLYGETNWGEQARQLMGVQDPYMTGTPVFQWKEEKQFGYNADGYTSNFFPVAGTYKPFTDLKGNTQLSNVFILKNGRYYELYGKTGTDLGEGDYSSVTFSRTITCEETETNEDGSETTTTTEVKQYLTKARKRDTYPSNCYLEGFWTINSCNSVFAVIDNQAYCMVGTTEDEKEYDVIMSLKEDGTTSYIAKVEAESIIDIFKDGEATYLAVSYDKETFIYRIDIIDGLRTTVRTDDLSNAIKKVEYLSADVDDSYHEAYEDMSEDESGKTLDENAGEYLNGDNVLRVSLTSTHPDLLQKIEDYKLEEYEKNHSELLPGIVKLHPEYQSLEKISDMKGEGYLITSFVHGLVYYDPQTQKAVSIDEGTWYGTWRMGDQLVSVGFGKSNSTYGTLDMAHARVMEYRIDDLYKSGLDSISQSIDTALSYVKKEATEDTKKMQGELDDMRKDETVVFVEPEEGEWKDNTPGSEVEKFEEERKKQKEEESKAREEAGEWSPLDEHFYGTD